MANACKSTSSKESNFFLFYSEGIFFFSRTHKYSSTQWRCFFRITVGRALSEPETASDSNISASVTTRMLELCACSHMLPRLSQPRTSTAKVHAKRQLQKLPPRAPKRCLLQPSWAACTAPSRACGSRSHNRVLCAQMSARLSFPATDRGRAALASGAREQSGLSGSTAHLQPAQVISKPFAATAVRV